VRARHRHSRQVALGAALVLVAVAVALIFVGFTNGNDGPSSAQAARPNLITNGSFERSLDGWSGTNARLTRVRGGASGRIAARVTVVPGAKDFSIFSPAHVAANAGTVYTATGWVRSPRPLAVCLRIREWIGPNEVGSRQRCVRPRARWRKFPAVRLTVSASSRELDVYAYRLGAGRGSRFDVDGITLVGRRATPLPPIPTSGPTLIAAGDIARCSGNGDEATAALLDRLRGTIATLGDNAYDDGSREEFARCYDPTWGRFKARTRPSPGNHEYHSRNAAPYYEYFGAAAGRQGRGYYSYSVGTWHVVALNSNCDSIGGCDEDSAQGRWLRADLRANRNRCTLAYWHHPRFSSGEHGGDHGVHGLWQVLYNANADVILSGHDHNYERFAPQTPAGGRNNTRGIRQFVVGTGGANLRTIRSNVAPNSEVRNSDTHGVLILSLRERGYTWRFVPIAGKNFTDGGTGTCH
jgi:Calcineurin-like phosphoesterase